MIITKIKHFLRNSRQYLFCRKNQASIEEYRYFIFLDSKVPNIIEQIYPYFQKGFFDKENVLIVFRHHFENIKSVRKALDKYSLNAYCFINLRDIPAIENGVWFYTHNSMTNLAVINKNVYSKHIWMGHGDSEKVSSYKKIIRIYDYLLVAGENSIERFYQHHIFRKEESYKFIRVGKAVLCSIIPAQLKENDVEAILFAPTWEGPMKEENYSTLHLSQQTAELLNGMAEGLSVNDIVLKFHPNTGIRETKYLEHCNKIVRTLLSQEKNLTLVTEQGTWIHQYFYKVFGNELCYESSLYNLESYKFIQAVTNISAMATMTYAEDINTIVLYDSTVNVQKSVDILFTEKIALDKIEKNSEAFFNVKMQQNSKIIAYEKGWEEMSQEQLFNQIVSFSKKI
ncbi:MAG: hypothetical protein K0U38_05800 [Epsilonproteobacteria bacterium]|nr:hypothetical protein [Campylobacterota bacterium]